MDRGCLFDCGRGKVYDGCVWTNPSHNKPLKVVQRDIVHMAINVNSVVFVVLEMAHHTAAVAAFGLHHNK